ncbi:MAG: OsmC family protein [Thermodesulfobacteriota bacterium]
MSYLNVKYSKGLLFAVAVVFFGMLSISYSGLAQAQTDTMVNGLNTATLNGLIETLKKNPEKGRVTFYSKSRWQDGMRSFSGFSGYSIDGKMVHEKTREFVLLGDESVELSGTDTAPGAVEELMYALATCVIAAANANAALMGVKLTRLDVDIESDLDLHGLFALDPNVRPGVTNMRMEITIAGDSDEETLKKIAMLGYQYSPVSDTTRNGVKFSPVVKVAK